jgi:hypothetical protein
MDMEILKNPWVIGGGLGLIVLLYLASNSGASASSGGGYSAANIAAANATAGALGIQSMQISANYGAAKAQADSANFGTFASALATMTQVNAGVNQGIDQVAGGVIGTALSSNAMVAAASVGASGQVSAVAEQGLASTSISKNSSAASIAQSKAVSDQASSAMWGNIASGFFHAASSIAPSL